MQKTHTISISLVNKYSSVTSYALLRVSQIQSLCQELESFFYDGTFPWQHLKQHDAASLLKLFIRELPHPLLTVEYLNAFVAVNSMFTTCSWSIQYVPTYHRNDANKAETSLCVFTELPTKKQQLHALNLLVLLLPEANRDTLKVDAQGLKVLCQYFTAKVLLNEAESSFCTSAD